MKHTTEIINRKKKNSDEKEKIQETNTQVNRTKQENK